MSAGTTVGYDEKDMHMPLYVYILAIYSLVYTYTRTSTYLRSLNLDRSYRFFITIN